MRPQFSDIEKCEDTPGKTPSAGRCGQKMLLDKPFRLGIMLTIKTQPRNK